MISNSFVKLSILALIFQYLETFSHASEDSLVVLNQGKIVSKRVYTVSKRSTYIAYKGIPYAKPPVAELKYMPPVEHDGWSGTLEAFNHGDICIQSYETSDDGVGSEDCLFINVYTPEIKKNFKENDKTYPVMFFVHGGIFRYGSGNTTLLGPDYFMDEKVILVTMNYRLGVHGFLDMENDVVTGNMGLKDVLMALKWVRKNIAEFGGDVDNVTIFGQGTGAMMVDILYLSDVSKGLFHKAILQSGTALDAKLFDWNPKQRAYNLTIHLNDEGHDDQSVIKILKERNPLDLPGNVMRTVHPDETIFKQIGFHIFSPSLNNKSEPMFLKKLPEELMDDGDLPNKDIPIMIGFNSQESIYDNRFFIQRPMFVKNLNKRFPFTLPLRGIYSEFDSDAYHSLQYRILWYYFNVTVDLTKDSVLNDYLKYNSDQTFIPVDTSVKAYAELNTAPVYYYKFDHIGELNYFRRKATSSSLPQHYPCDGASEKDELCYLFKCNIMRSKYEKLHEYENEEVEGEKKEHIDLKMLRKMIRLWTNFAKTGNPTPSDDDVLEGLEWKPVKTDEINYLNIQDEFTMDHDPNADSVEFWNAMYEYYTPIAVDGVLKDVPDGYDEEKVAEITAKLNEKRGALMGETDEQMTESDDSKKPTDDQTQAEPVNKNKEEL